MPTLNREGTNDCSFSLINLLPFTRLPGSVLAENKEIFSEQVYYLRRKEINLSDHIKTIKEGTVMVGHDDEHLAEEEFKQFVMELGSFEEKQTCFKVLDADCLQVAHELIEKTGRTPMVLNLGRFITIKNSITYSALKHQEEQCVESIGFLI